MAIEAGIPMLRKLLASTGAPSLEDPSDYRIAAALGTAFLARGRAGRVTLLVPLPRAGGAVGRSGGGFTLSSAPQVAFAHSGRNWDQATAILECTDDKLADAFLVLVLDLTTRMASISEGITWPVILSWVEEWQILLGRKQLLSPEQQLGLWGELWVMARATNVDSLFGAWLGPDQEPIDFFYDAIGLEVKATRRAHVHHVSQSQVDRPRGEFQTYLLSIWVGVDSNQGISLAEKVDLLINRISDPTAFLRRLAQVGYTPHDREEYLTKFLVLEEPRWFSAEDVPSVREIDAGVSHVRYVVTLDLDDCLGPEQSLRLGRHFWGSEPQLAVNSL
jgi:Putative  PD-(D/E)XK family member, (DUF4420)